MSDYDLWRNAPNGTFKGYISYILMAYELQRAGVLPSAYRAVRRAELTGRYRYPQDPPPDSNLPDLPIIRWAAKYRVEH